MGGGNRMERGRKILGYLQCLIPIKRGQGQISSLLFWNWNVSQNIKIKDKKFFCRSLEMFSN
jgi:hypothetical protein